MYSQKNMSFFSFFLHFFFLDQFYLILLYLLLCHCVTPRYGNDSHFLFSRLVLKLLTTHGLDSTDTRLHGMLAWSACIYFSPLLSGCLSVSSFPSLLLQLCSYSKQIRQTDRHRFGLAFYFVGTTGGIGGVA